MADDFGLGYALGQDNGSARDGDGMWGGGFIWIIVLLFLLFGFGRNGFGGNGDCATQADVRAAVDQQTLISKLDQQTYGLADSYNALNNTITNGFHGVDNAICNLGFQTQNGFNGISRQLSDCCCTIERQIERGFCDTNANIAAQTQAILGYLTNDKIDSLRAENQTLRFAASQDRQNALLTTAMTQQTNALIDRIAPYPVPSFNVCAPYHYGYGAYGGWGGYGRDGGCGCACA